MQNQASYVARFCVYIHLEYIVIQAYILSMFFYFVYKDFATFMIQTN